jgi:hypothetical protein
MQACPAFTALSCHREQQSEPPGTGTGPLPTGRGYLLFGQPQQPLPPHGRALVRRRVVLTVHHFLQELGVPSPGARKAPPFAHADPSDARDGPAAAPAWIAFACRESQLEGLTALIERLLKRVIGGLHADLIGGDNVTRLDRILVCRFPRLSHQAALCVLSRIGMPRAVSDGLDNAVTASLCRHCADLPVLLLHGECGTEGGVDLLLPYAGWAGQARPIPAHPGWSRVRLLLGGLLQYLLGQPEPVEP